MLRTHGHEGASLLKKFQVNKETRRTGILTFMLHVLSASVAVPATMVVHVVSGRALWAFFPSAFNVRQFSIYLIDVLPFFIVCMLLVLTVHRVVLSRVRVSFMRFVLLSMAGAVLTVLVHELFFPSDIRAWVILALFTIFYVLCYASLSAIIGELFQRWASPIVDVSLRGWGAFTFLIIAYAGGLGALSATGVVVEEELFRTTNILSPSKTWYKETHAEKAPKPRLFSMKPLAQTKWDVNHGYAGFVDVDGNGFFDLVAQHSQGGIEIWFNDNGTFRRERNPIGPVGQSSVGSYAFVDYDGNGMADLFFAEEVVPARSHFETTFLKKLYFYPFFTPVSRGRLIRQSANNQWDDVTQAAFPNGAPEAYRKAEPLLWFDPNNDGRLDVIWSGYPHRRNETQKLYIQQADGTFVENIDAYLRGNLGNVYAEGSDVADIDGDGDIDFFAYGYLFENDNGTYVQRCGEMLPGVYCGAEARNEEGALIEDIDGDGVLDFVMSYHGVGAEIPKYYLQFFRGLAEPPGTLVREKRFERLFYGYNTYLRAKDFDFNGRADILMNDPGRLLTLHNGEWLDLMPAVSSAPSGDFWPLGWLDIDEDGDWDFLSVRRADSQVVLFENTINPKRYVKISVRGERGVENQIGATVQIRHPGGRVQVESYRPMAGYGGVADPRIVVPLDADRPYEIRACFASMSEKPKMGLINVAGEKVNVNVLGVENRCVTYGLNTTAGAGRVDLTLVAGPTGAIVTQGGAISEQH
jgi:hypothetical protein